MALNKYKLGDLIEVVDERNNLGIRDFYGININKEFMPTAANTEGLDETKYKVVRKNRFVYSGMQTGRDECIRISMYNDDTPILVSPAYTTFEVTATDVVIPLYFFMKFFSKEKDRYGAFCSDGSIRSNLDWDVFCDIELDLPPIETQKKYVNIYNAMLENQKCYERGLEDLKLVCDAYFDKNKNKNLIALEKLIKKQNKKNTDFKVKKLIGIGKDGIIPPKQDKDETNGHICYLVNYKDFVFAPPQVHNGSLDLYMGSETVKCSDAYYVFRIIDENVLLPEYLKMYLKTPQFQHYAFYYRDGVREQFDYEQLKEHRIFLPSMEEQKSIIEIFKILEKRKTINEKLKSQIKNICPILIKGSIEEEKTKEV